MHEKTKQNIVLAVAWMLLLAAVIVGVTLICTGSVGSWNASAQSLFV